MAQAARRIVTEVHDEPHVEGHRVTVRRLQGLVEETGKSATEVAKQFNLDAADVYAALQYYHTHPDEMDRAEETRRSREDDARRAGAKSLTEIRQERDEGSNGVPDSR
ncbi:DUF433 domain-containing protein [Natrinema salsiterrestre]|uniref:DUF433 domain-containing protein n=1 Tax=Natrinema salsiterrestre TaxID=2950540 RepID=A0A9Q4L5M3_9EURY|nr:DUF433 domain-containing protein [Natrinema salsiterrestre]MDF9746967.1 DUF433 domain-containing protein [Natrinema salsiterrestre]